MLADKGIDTYSNLLNMDCETILDMLEYYNIQNAIQWVQIERAKNN